MKLWQKIFLCSLALVILAIDVTSVLLLSNSHRLTVMREEQNAVSEHKYLSVMLKDNVIYERLKQNKVFLTEEEVIQVTQSAFEPQSSARTIGLSLYTGQRRLLSYNGRSEQLEVSILQSASQSSVLNQVQGLGGYALGIIGFNSAKTIQTQEVLDGIYNIATLLPGILYLGVALSLLFLYPLNKKRVEENITALKLRREQESAG